MLASARFSTVALALLAAPSCGSSHAVRPEPAPAPASRPVAVDGKRPVELKIADLVKDVDVVPAKTVRIRGVISSIVGIRMVPAKVIFKISDSSETLTVVLNERVTLKEGTRVELVGRYKKMPSPTHTGPGEPPWEAVFEVERYLDLH